MRGGNERLVRDSTQNGRGEERIGRRSVLEGTKISGAGGRGTNVSSGPMGIDCGAVGGDKSYWKREALSGGGGGNRRSYTKEIFSIEGKVPERRTSNLHRRTSCLENREGGSGKNAILCHSKLPQEEIPISSQKQGKSTKCYHERGRLQRSCGLGKKMQLIRSFNSKERSSGGKLKKNGNELDGHREGIT